MKTTTFAAAAGLLGLVSADGWDGWSSSSSSSSSDPSTTWSDWTSTTTSQPSDPTTWDPWTSTTSTQPAGTSTSTSASTWSEWDPSASTTTSTTVTWDPWISTSTQPAGTITTSSPTWIVWDPSASTTTSPSASWDPWTSTSTQPAATSISISPSTWIVWDPSTSTASPSVIWDPWSTTSSVTTVSGTSTSSWSNWDPTQTITSTSTQWITVTLFSVTGTDGTWTAWSSAATPVAGTVTNKNTVTVTGTITKTSSINSGKWGAWSSASTPVAGLTTKPADGQCVVKYIVSYGEPVWIPTPALATSGNANAWDPWGVNKTSTSASAKATTSHTQGAGWGLWASGSASVSTPIQGFSTPKASPSGTTWSAWPSSTDGSTGISANGNYFGMTWSPYTASGGCKDANTVAADIAKMASLGFSSVRVYSTDCSTLEYVGAAVRANNMKVILGVWISTTGISGAQAQADAIAKWAQWDLVELIVVGNEAVFNGYCTASDLAAFISSCKASFQAAGYTGAVSTTDELSIWQSEGSAWCDAVDVVTANLYAFFNPDTTADNAGSFIQAEIESLSNICPGKEVYVMESGWPSAGECNGVACPSPQNQKTAIKSILQSSGAKVVFFSFEDELWKQPGPFGVEQHWGCADIFS